MSIQKQVAQFKDGQLVAIYESANKAAEAVGSINASISKCCLGKRKEVNGFTFQYTGKSNAKQPSGDVKCPYCDKQFKNYNGLTKHIFKFKQHGDGITQEQLLTDYKYGGIRPTCKCGCGEYTEISYEGGAHFRNYLYGHHSRVHNNWGHNPTAIQHSAETRRKQYQSGKRIQWNKGKSWKETYTDEQIQELMKMYTKERGAKISVFFKGVPKTEEHKRKLKEAFNTDEYREKSRKNIRQLYSS